MYGDGTRGSPAALVALFAIVRSSSAAGLDCPDLGPERTQAASPAGQHSRPPATAPYGPSAPFSDLPVVRSGAGGKGGRGDQGRGKREDAKTSRNGRGPARAGPGLSL